jgi:hypothetical protein
MRRHAAPALPDQVLAHAGAGVLRYWPREMHEHNAALFCGVCDLVLCFPGLLDYCLAWQKSLPGILCAALEGAAAAESPAPSGMLVLMRLQLTRVLKALIKVAAFSMFESCVLHPQPLLLPYPCF